MVNTGPLGPPPDDYPTAPITADPHLSQIHCSCGATCRRCRKAHAQLEVRRRQWDIEQALTDDDRQWLSHHYRLAGT